MRESISKLRNLSFSKAELSNPIRDIVHLAVRLVQDIQRNSELIR